MHLSFLFFFLFVFQRVLFNYLSLFLYYLICIIRKMLWTFTLKEIVWFRVEQKFKSNFNLACRLIVVIPTWDYFLIVIWQQFMLIIIQQRLCNIANLHRHLNYKFDLALFDVFKPASRLNLYAHEAIVVEQIIASQSDTVEKFWKSSLILSVLICSANIGVNKYDLWYFTTSCNICMTFSDR